MSYDISESVTSSYKLKLGNLFFQTLAEAYSESYQTSKIELFAKTVKGFHSLTSLAKSSVLDVRINLRLKGSEYLCAMQVRSTLIHFLVRNRVKGTRIYAMMMEANKGKFKKAIFGSFEIYKATAVTIRLKQRYLNP